MAISKFSIIGLLLFCNTLLLSAQVDSKYLVGAVPQVDGRVIFTREVKVNTSVSKDQLYDLVKEWMDKEFPESTETKQRVLLADKDQSYIVAQGDEKLVFKSMMLMIDQTEMTYQLVARVEKGKCLLEVRNIKYEYQDYDKTMPAEEMITDKVALHKSGEKLNRHYDKFRTFTIDRVDNLKSNLVDYLGQVSLEEVKPKEAKVVSIIDLEEPSTETKMIVSVPATAPFAIAPMTGFKNMDKNKLSESIVKMIKDSRVVVAVGKGVDAKVFTGTWKSLGDFEGVPMVSTFVNELQADSEDVYTISFYTEIHGDALDKLEKADLSTRLETPGLTLMTTTDGTVAFGEAWMVIECKKLSNNASNEAKLNEGAQSKKWKNTKNLRLYLGEVLNIWAR